MHRKHASGVQALQGNTRIRSQAAPLATPLAKLVEDGASKLAQRTTGVSALLACCHIAAASHEADEALKQNKVGHSGQDASWSALDIPWAAHASQQV